MMLLSKLNDHLNISTDELEEMRNDLPEEPTIDEWFNGLDELSKRFILRITKAYEDLLSLYKLQNKEEK